jgi:carbamoyl-phosphate synthase small subunit
MIPSKLILASGELFPGYSPFQQTGSFFGEVVFSTGMTGYVESLTDPSYKGQILVFTYPLIGNYGVPPKKTWESDKIQVSGVCMANVSSFTSHWDKERSLIDWLKAENIPWITDVDTRELTKHLRKKGASLGAISTETPSKFFDPNERELVKEVSCKQKSTLRLGTKKVIAVDCGMKENILRHLHNYPIELVKVPFDYDYSEEPFDALFISNGPGDPSQCTKTIEILRKALKRKKPTFGICLGAQILALAIGAKTYKLKFGHRGQNHPCFDIDRNVSILTSQNHGYAIDETTLTLDWRVTFKNLNDQSVEGIAHRELPFFAVQFHPESHPGPTDAAYLFDTFYEMVR